MSRMISKTESRRELPARRHFSSTDVRLLVRNLSSVFVEVIEKELAQQRER
jgi:hypothetical protein